MEGTRKLLLVEKISEVGDFGGDTKDSIRDFILKKLHLILHFLENTWGFLAEKLNEVLPPERRSHWVHVGLTLVLPIALALLCLYCCCKCCCCSSGRGAGKMMKAPGRRGALMPRASFAGNPKGYFSGLRANKPLVY